MTRHFSIRQDMRDITRTGDQYRRSEPGPTRYYIDGEEVDEATWNAELDKEPRPKFPKYKPSVPPSVCVRHRVFLPCRRCNYTIRQVQARWSTDPGDVEAVRRYQQGNDE